MNKKRCPYCQVFKPESEIRYEWRGRGSRRIKKLICASCQDARKQNLTVAQRDEFGRQVTENNRAEQSRILKEVQQQKEGKTHDDIQTDAGRST